MDPLHWPTMLLRYVNTSDARHSANLELSLSGEYIAKRKIANGEELFIDHGEDFLRPCVAPCGHMYCASVREGGC